MSLADIKHPVLYSTMTAVAFNVNNKYYGGRHYMWCTPYFGSDFKSPHFTVPPSSSPLEIYNTILKEIDGCDLHNSKIELNRMGIRKGAEIMRQRDIIDDETLKDIISISKAIPMHQFRPILCIIPRLEALPYYKKVDVLSMANPLSHEYIVADLPQSTFDVIRIG
jgi:hypothetical protein